MTATMSGRAWRLLGCGVAAVAVAAALAGVAKGAAGAKSCDTTPLRDGCVKSVKQVDSATFQVTVKPDGTLSTTWSPEAPGTTVALPEPMPAEDAMSFARSNNLVTPQFAQPAGATAASKRKRARMAAGYTSYCVSDTYFPLRLHNDAWSYYMRSHSAQSCVGAAVSSHRTVSTLSRQTPPDFFWDVLDVGSGVGLAGYGIDAYGRYNCNHTRNLEYTSRGDFWVTNAGKLIQGPTATRYETWTCPG